MLFHIFQTLDPEIQELEKKHLSLDERYQKALKDKQEALEENQRATISFAIHFDEEVAILNDQIKTLIKERDKANTEASDLEIKLTNTKYELHRLQREHIKLQLEQEKYLNREESFADQLKKVEGEKSILNDEIETLKHFMETTMGENKSEKVCSFFIL